MSEGTGKVEGIWMLAIKFTLVVFASVIVAINVFQWGLQPSPKPLRVAINPWPGYEFATLAREKGFFKLHGVDVRLVDQYSLNDCRRTFERGQVDCFFGTVIEYLQASVHSDREPVIVMATDYSDGADVILGLPEIRSVSDLKGKKIAVERGTLSEYVLARALEKNGLNLSSVERVNMPTLSMPNQLQKRQIDAVVTYPPASIEIQKSMKVNRVFDSKELHAEVLDVMIVDRNTYENRRQEIDGFIKAFFQAQDYTRLNPEESHEIMAARERITAAEFKRNLTNGIRILQMQDQKHILGDNGLLGGVIEKSRQVISEADPSHQKILHKGIPVKLVP